MCHDHDSRPPAPPRTGDVRERGVLTLTSGDGTEFSAAYAAPADTPDVGVVVLPDIRGLHPYYVALAERFAETGAVAVAIDWFGRSAGVCGDPGTRGEGFDWQTHIPQTTPGSAPGRTSPSSRSGSASAAATRGGSPGAAWTLPAAPASTASRRWSGRPPPGRTCRR
jgi:carboxymethylenebutenolidase